MPAQPSPGSGHRQPAWGLVLMQPCPPPAWGPAGRPPPPILPSRVPGPSLTRAVGPGRASWLSSPAALSPLWLQKEKLSAQASLKRHTSLNDLSLTRDEQEIEFLRLQVLEQQHVIDDLSLVRPCSARALHGTPGDASVGKVSGLRAVLPSQRVSRASRSPVPSCFVLPGSSPHLAYTASRAPGSGFHGHSFLPSPPWFAAVRSSTSLKNKSSGLYRVGMRWP